MAGDGAHLVGREILGLVHDDNVVAGAMLGLGQSVGEVLPIAHALLLFPLDVRPHDFRQEALPRGALHLRRESSARAGGAEILLQVVVGKPAEDVLDLAGEKSLIPAAELVAC